jgi:hypothetical protein
MYFLRIVFVFPRVCFLTKRIGESKCIIIQYNDVNYHITEHQRSSLVVVVFDSKTVSFVCLYLLIINMCFLAWCSLLFFDCCVIFMWFSHLFSCFIMQYPANYYPTAAPVTVSVTRVNRGVGYPAAYPASYPAAYPAAGYSTSYPTAYPGVSYPTTYPTGYPASYPSAYPAAYPASYSGLPVAAAPYSSYAPAALTSIVRAPAYPGVAYPYSAAPVVSAAYPTSYPAAYPAQYPASYYPTAVAAPVTVSVTRAHPVTGYGYPSAYPYGL